MATIPQRYYDTCTRVRQHLQQSSQQQQQWASPSEERSLSSGSSPYRVLTMPIWPPTVGFVKTESHAHVDTESPSAATEVCEASVCDGSTAEKMMELNLEERYMQLLKRIVDETANA
ncbi:hypothetical protein ABL78_6035 [Leptomonas seymouri]|uniref:Uncharacterized protein n=1 Tax=Leptomonas seymouri TaxID=5684 RepID=A0A0N1HU97_LEPSE|nr:hypothetical protein ABL78_6035 [Leptomonas seymouri]|eukprot:KPI84910.1 hypothetical protein ABL78_6035 [Leptomonas seymouri]